MLKELLPALLLLSAFSIPHSAFSIPHSALPVSVLRSTGGMPAHAAGAFDIAACHVAPGGDYLVFDRRSHGVHRVTRDGDRSTIVQMKKSLRGNHL